MISRFFTEHPKVYAALFEFQRSRAFQVISGLCFFDMHDGNANFACSMLGQCSPMLAPSSSLTQCRPCRQAVYDAQAWLPRWLRYFHPMHSFPRKELRNSIAKQKQ